MNLWCKNEKKEKKPTKLLRLLKQEKEIGAIKNESKSSNLPFLTNCSILPSPFADMLMGNQSSNKATDSRSIQTLSLWLLSLRDTNAANTVMFSKSILLILFFFLQKGELFTFMLCYVTFILIYAIWFMCVPVCRDSCLSPTLCAAVSLQDDSYYYDYSSPELNCSTTESIKGGSVTYSLVKLIHYLASFLLRLLKVVKG